MQLFQCLRLFRIMRLICSKNRFKFTCEGAQWLKTACLPERFVMRFKPTTCITDWSWSRGKCSAPHVSFFVPPTIMMLFRPTWPITFGLSGSSSWLCVCDVTVCYICQLTTSPRKNEPWNARGHAKRPISFHSLWQFLFIIFSKNQLWRSQGYRP